MDATLGICLPQSLANLDYFCLFLNLYIQDCTLYIYCVYFIFSLFSVYMHTHFPQIINCIFKIYLHFACGCGLLIFYFYVILYLMKTSELFFHSTIVRHVVELFPFCFLL